MKIIKTILIGCVVFSIFIFIGIFIFLKTFDLNRYLPFLTKEASRFLGREVSIKKADLNFSLGQGARLNIQGVAIADDARFSQDQFLTVERIFLGVDLLSLLAKRQIKIFSIDIHASTIRIVRGKDQRFNIQTFAPLEGKNFSKEGTSQATSAFLKDSKSGKNLMPVFLVNNFQMTDARIEYSDRSFNPAVHLVVSNARVEVLGFSLQDPFKFKMDVSVFSKENNIHVNGSVRLNVLQEQIRLDDTRIQMDLSGVDLKETQQAFAAVKGIGLESSLKGKLDFLFSPLIVGPTGLLVLTAEGQLVHGEFKMKRLLKPVEEMAFKWNANEQKINIKNFVMTLGTGRIKGEMNIKDYLTTAKTTMMVEADDIDLAETIDQSNFPGQIKGRLFGALKAEAEGLDDKMLSTLNGETIFEIKNGSLQNVNLLQMVLGKITVIPNLAELIEQQLSSPWKELLAKKEKLHL